MVSLLPVTPIFSLFWADTLLFEKVSSLKNESKSRKNIRWFIWKKTYHKYKCPQSGHVAGKTIFLSETLRCQQIKQKKMNNPKKKYDLDKKK